MSHLTPTPHQLQRHVFCVTDWLFLAYAVLSDPKKRRQYDSYFFADSDDDYSGEEDDSEEEEDGGDEACGMY